MNELKHYSRNTLRFSCGRILKDYFAMKLMPSLEVKQFRQKGQAVASIVRDVVI